MQTARPNTLSEKRALLFSLWRDVGSRPKSGRLLSAQTAAAVTRRLKQQKAKPQTDESTQYPDKDQNIF